MTGPNANGPYAFKWPSNTDALYASKHNPFVNFTGTQGALANMVPDNQLASTCHAQPAQLQPGRPGPMPRHARHGRLFGTPTA